MSKAAELAALIGSQTAQSNRNLIINGAMNVAQRGTSFADPSDGSYSLDRMNIFNNNDGATTITQDSTVPSGEGFYNSIKFDVTTADGTIAAGQYLALNQKIEGKNHAILGYGASGAKTIVVSFYAKSNLTGIYNYSVRNSVANRAYIKEFSITSANTWERISFTIPGDTSGTWLTTNGNGAIHQISLSMGSTFQGTANQYNSTNVVATSNQVNFLSSTDNEFFVTGWQVEIGEVATPFEHRSFADEYAACQRYYFKMGQGVGGLPTPSGDYFRYAIGACQGSTSAECQFFPPVPMRTTPTLEQTGTAGDYALYEADAVHALTGVPAINSAQSSFTQFNVTASSNGNLASGNAAELMNNNNGTAYLAFSAEL